MLTQNDLNQIRQVVKEAFTDYPTKQDVNARFEKLETKIDKGFKKLDKRLKISFDYLDKRFIKHNHRLEKIETNLGLPVQSSL